MADVEALRAKIVELGRGEAAARRGKFNVNELYTRLDKHFHGESPISRATLYSWFGNGGVPKQSLLECVPAFAAIFGVQEYELWQAAGILPPPMEASLAISSAVHDLRAAHRRMQKTLSNNGLSTAGEALVVDRIMHAKLDYRMEVWPVVRGRIKPLHLHSWIALTPLAESESTRRQPTEILERLPVDERRHYLRHSVITDSLWRTLGLNWRDQLPDHFVHLGPDALFIEVPVEERNRTPRPDPLYPSFDVDHILVLGAPWAHAELMVALLADALQFGSWDLRYLGLTPGQGRTELEQFCRSRLRERRSRYVWAIAQRSDVMTHLRSDVVAAALPGTLIVVVTYGARLAEFASAALHTKLDYVADADRELHRLADACGQRGDVIRVHIADEDVLGEVGTARDEPAIRDRMVDHVRHLSAAVLDHLYWRRNGPGLPLWGDRFADLRVGDEASIDPPAGPSTVQWLPRGG